MTIDAGFKMLSFPFCSTQIAFCFVERVKTHNRTLDILEVKKKGKELHEFAAQV
jgi:hypothetical protein